MGFRLTVLAALLLSHATHCESATLTINPNPLSISGNTTGNAAVTVTIKCSDVPPANFDYYFTLTISRNLTTTTSNTNFQQIATATVKIPEAHMLTPIPGASASGSLAENFIMVTMTSMSCNDAGTYRCTASYAVVGEGAGLPQYSVEDKEFTVQVVPGPIKLTPIPLFTNYELNSTLEMTCNGQVGSTTSGTQISWVWEYQVYQSFSWIPYTPETDITPPSPPLTDNKCQNNQVSVLTRRITLEDEKRTYRCSVRRNGQSFENSADSYQIGTVGIIGQTPAPSTSKASSASVGPIVGGVIGGLLLLTIIIVLVYFLWYRKRDKGEKYQPKETDLPKPADETGPYPSYPPSSIPPSQTRFKRGVANKAMDETEEKPDKKAPVDSKPPRYDNDFRKGGYNPGYDVDHQERPRRYSSDDGGTDRSVNLSVGDGDPNMGTAI